MSWFPGSPCLSLGIMVKWICAMACDTACVTMRHSLRDHATVALTLRHCKDIAGTTAAGWHAISL